jgi:monothiol glutaredoxin
MSFWKRADEQAVTENPLVLFMKGTPEQPQCGFSRAVCQILDVQVSHCADRYWVDADEQGVPRETIKSFNCLADQELREGIKEYRFVPLFCVT